MAQSRESGLGSTFQPGTDFGARSIPATLAALLAAAFDVLVQWQARSRERRHLLTLNDHLLKDMGLSRADVSSEAGKPFWRS